MLHNNERVEGARVQYIMYPLSASPCDESMPPPSRKIATGSQGIIVLCDRCKSIDKDGKAELYTIHVDFPDIGISLCYVDYLLLISLPTKCTCGFIDSISRVHTENCGVKCNDR